ncbi:MAG: MBL fold metallo-hydrolase [Actinobacteria bacterium]|nr:MBL fold metallo-hydrolase [Actinomycetota bacterium]MCL6104561.1 MBL fold metallo-hydrolase [Actinomycetota bacterium]
MLENFTWFKQSSYLYKDDEITCYVDPWALTTDDPADVILITHAHFDHYSPEDIEKVQRDKTIIVAPADIAKELSGNIVPIAPGDSKEVSGIKIQAVPAYNTLEERLEFHPKKNKWVGYLIELGGVTYYHAGDTDHAPELSDIQTDIAFLPIGGTYTMDVPQAAGLARAINPQLAVPMHYGFVVGASSDADAFAAQAAPVAVQTLQPIHPFEK